MRVPPPPLTGEARGTWAHSTIVERLPEIAARVLAENELVERQANAVARLISDIPDSLIRPLQDRSAPDFSDWVEYCKPHLDRDWLEVPWFFAETYFYRRTLEAVDYYSDPNDLRRDPFLVQKDLALDQMGDFLRRSQSRQQSLRSVFDLSLWGNQSDLSLWPVGSEQDADRSGRRTGSRHILVDDLVALLDYLDDLSTSGARFDLVLDNVGIELAADLLLAEQLLERWPTALVVLHVKAHPTFVSDATGSDLQRTLQRLTRSGVQAVSRLADALTGAAEAQRMLIQDDPFWTSPLALWEMPGQLFETLARSSLIILKGDANYRRALGDRHWPYSTPFREIVGYLPAPLVALRTLKSQVASGIPPDVAEAAAGQDPEWMTDGRWAQRQLYLPAL